MNHIQHIGEGSGWAAGLLGSLTALTAGSRIVGAITPDGVNQWIVLTGGAAIGLVGLGTVIYHRVLEARLDGRTVRAIYGANIAAIAQGKDVPFPSFMPQPRAEDAVSRGRLNLRKYGQVTTPDPDSPPDAGAA